MMLEAKSLYTNLELGHPNLRLGHEMVMLSDVERDVLLTLFSEFQTDYNANSISKKLKVSDVGALKALRKLDKKQLVISREYAGAKFYKVNLDSEYAQVTMKYILFTKVKEKGGRWSFILRDIIPEVTATMMFGSALRDYEKANDIDVVIVLKNQKIYEKVKEIVSKENSTRKKKVNVLYQTDKDIVRNLKKPDPVLVNALKFGMVVSGFETIIKAVRDAQKAHGNFAVPKPETRYSDPFLN
jgi:predicted nucleotidyltransferase